MDDQNMVMLKGVRVSYPHLFKRPVIRGEEGKFGAVLLIDKAAQAGLAAAVRADIDALVSGTFKGKKLPPDKLCLRDGDESGKDEAVGCWLLSSNTDKPPVVIDQYDPNRIVEDDASNAIYAGCYVNVKVRLWVQNNQYGKRVNAALVAIQFASDGEAFTAAHVSRETAVAGFEAAGDASDWG